jgi:NAD(P)H-hydrate epimerase
MASLLIKTRKKFSHKGHYGHAALLTGSLGMMGAATLCASACLRSGAGKLTCYLPQCGYAIMQITLPEATCTINGLDFLENWDPIVEHEAIGIGPGIGMHEKTVLVLKKLLLSVKKPMVFDADALNILASSPELMQQLPAHSILTPHPKEFERLFGKVEHDEERLELALAKAQLYNIYIVLKGHNSFIACPDGKGYFNETGNPGMATGGSGDVLTGILVGLLAQGYSSLETCILGVYVHGLAGDIAAAKLSMEAMLASDLTNNLGEAFLFIHHHRSTRRIV